MHLMQCYKLCFAAKPFGFISLYRLLNKTDILALEQNTRATKQTLIFDAKNEKNGP